MASTQTFGKNHGGFQVGNNFGQIDNVNINTVYSDDDVDRLCLRTLRCPDSFAVKNRLKGTKDKLVHASIEWIFRDPRYIGWQDGEETGLLWIKGGAGKGKTMMSIGLIERLLLARNGPCVVTYFFCQDADHELNTLESVIKGLILQLLNQEERLKVSLRNRWDTVNGRFEKDVSSWEALWNILLEMLNNCKCQRVYVLVDALDECRDSGMADFLKLIVRTGLDQVSKIKWLLTSRPLESAQRELLVGNDQEQVILELQSQQFSEAIRTYIASKVAELNRRHRYQEELRKKIETTLNDRSEGTYLWVSLACKRLENVHRNEALAAIQQLPPGLHSIYHRMYTQLGIGDIVDRKRCMELLNVMMLAYQPLQVVEVESLTGFTDEYSEIEDLVGKCASFITMRGTFIEFIHQSARDFLAEEKRQSDLLNSHEHFGHGELALRCLSSLCERLKVNICDLPRPDSTRKSIQESKNKQSTALLSRTKYAALFWPQHLESGKQSRIVQNALGERGLADEFLRTRLLEWLECLSLLDELQGALKGLQAIRDTAGSASPVAILTQDATRFLLRHYHTITNWPLQIYSSGIIFSPEKSIVRGANMEKIPIWIKNVPRMESVWSSLISTLFGPAPEVADLVFSPDGKSFASGSSNNVIGLWNATTGDLLRIFEASSSIFVVAFAPDGKTIASGCRDGYIRLWDTTTGASHHHVKAHWYPIHAIAFTPDGNHIASASKGDSIRLWDLTTVTIRDLHTTFVSDLGGFPTTMTFSPGGKYIAIGFGDETINLWDTFTGDLLKTLKDGPWQALPEAIITLAISPNGRLLASGTISGTIHIWDTFTGDRQTPLRPRNQKKITAISFSPNGEIIALGYDDGIIKLLNIMTGDIQKTFSGHLDFINATTFSPDGKNIISASRDMSIKLWDATTGDFEQRLEAHRYNTTAASSSADGLITSGGIGNDTKLYHTASIEGHSREVANVMFSPDGKQIASASDDATINLWNATTGEVQKTLKDLTDGVFSLAFSPSGKYIASGSLDETVKLWDTRTGVIQETFRGHSDAIYSVAFSPDGKQIASGSWDKTVKLWDCATGNLQKTFEGHTDGVHILAFSPDGKFIASGGDNSSGLGNNPRSIKLWNISTGDLQRTLKSDSNCSLAALTFSPDCSYIASASVFYHAGFKSSSTINIWAIARVLNGTESFSTRFSRNFRLRPSEKFNIQGPVRTLEFSTDGKILKTDIGAIRLKAYHTDGDSSSLEFPDSLGVEGQWIKYGDLRILRLPSDFKPVLCDVRDDRVAIGFENGRVLGFIIDCVRLKALYK
ncbi:uncharacterized protein N7503_007153 [Penicillium pulvis]|uniref:uncharacterized protein n=1 Tax=Penicillium pulvis TaxID=1562058 RepID=UPI002546DD76|nr:uncharacterized protein N7503_007153 [Penicillium pulvis]KAJ5797857.1 hypothetical protein N7503_007153 [Penicillium pulvis]